VALRRCGTVGFIYSLEVEHGGYILFHGVEHTPVTGYYEGNDGRALFTSLVKTLQEADFFSLRLKKSPTLYVDGPCQTIEVRRCGVITAVGGLGTDMLHFEADLDDPQTAHLDAVITKLQEAIFGWRWSGERGEPTPSPSPAHR